MSATVLIIEPASIPPESSCRSVLNLELSYQRQAWENFRPEVLLGNHPQLVVPHVVTESQGVASFFRFVRENPRRFLTLAVLPERPGPVLLAASEVADDIVFWPARGQELDVRIQRLLQDRRFPEQEIENELGMEMGLAQLVGMHPSILRAARQAVSYAGSSAPVFITGETGTGKELFAHAIHSLSKCKRGPFVPVDCGSLPEQLAENELFGHCRGAFTDAHKDQRGLAAMATNGTLFLDEVDALSPANQAKLLRLLQEGTYRALGSEHFNRSNARVIAATNRMIEDRVQEGQFRNDLYFRLNVLRLHLPPLRERREDIALLVQHFLNKEFASERGPKSFSAVAMCKIENHSWPGNVRELFNVVQRAVLCSSGQTIVPSDIVFFNEAVSAKSNLELDEGFRRARQQAIEQFERGYVEHILARHGGNVTQAALEAGKERRSFGKLVKKYDLGTKSNPNT
jgi:DNA-binding NtrC family response regulator